MEHTPTVLHRLKRYPTYQFHAEIRSVQLSESEIFHRLILETLSWLRARLNNDVPKELDTPAPEAYTEFSEGEIHSFSLDQGWKADVTYVPEQGIWAFSLQETDMGANIGKENERLPVQGRLFKTDISFVKCSSTVECGVRTTVTEPVECDAPCEVFRPAVVRSILMNPQFKLSHGGIMLDAKPFVIDTKANAERFTAAFQNPQFDYPLILVADAGFEEEKQQAVPAELPKIGGLSLDFSAVPLDRSAPTLTTKDEKAKPFLKSKKQKPSAKPTSIPKAEAKKALTRRAEFPYERLADKLKGFGIVCYVSENILSVLDNKLHLAPKPGDIIVCVRCVGLDQFKHIIITEELEGGLGECSGFNEQFSVKNSEFFSRNSFDHFLVAVRYIRDVFPLQYFIEKGNIVYFSYSYKNDKHIIGFQISFFEFRFICQLTRFSSVRHPFRCK